MLRILLAAVVSASDGSFAWGAGREYPAHMGAEYREKGNTPDSRYAPGAMGKVVLLARSAGNGGYQDSIFDGRPAAVAAPGWRQSSSAYSVPRTDGRTVEDAAPAEDEAPAASIVPADLLQAGARRSNDAQIARLLNGHSDPEEAFTLAVIGDAEPGRFPWERVFEPARDAFPRQMQSIQSRHPDLVVQLGDFVSKGTAANYRDYVEYLDRDVSVPLLTVIGNHDRSRPNGAADKTLFQAVFGKSDFFVDYNGWRLIGLDTADRRLAGGQIDWLNRVLNTPLHKIIFTHVPPGYLRGQWRRALPPNVGVKSVRREGYLHDFTEGYFDEGSREFADLVAHYGVDRVYMGHIHAFGLAVHQGVRYVLSGGGGSPLYPMPPGYPSEKMAHYILAEIGPSGVRETVVPLDAAEFQIRF